MKPSLVVKVGGALLKEDSVLSELFKVCAQLMEHFSLVLVHGGGDTTQALLEKLSFSSVKKDGIRVTPDEHLPYVVGALAGTVNTQLCAIAAAQNLSPVGLTLLDGAICKAKKMAGDFGAVGEVSPGEAALLENLCSEGYLPIISSIASSETGQLLNVNADDAAAAIAQLIGADLLLLSDVPGVLDANQQPIAKLDGNMITELCSAGVIQGGMVVKVKSALATANQTQKAVIISSWKQPQQLMALVSKQPCGTTVLPESMSLPL